MEKRQAGSATTPVTPENVPIDMEGVLKSLAGLLSFSSAANPDGLPTLRPGHTGADATPEIEARYRTLVEQIPAVIFMAALGDGPSEAYVSPYLESILGITREEWLDDPLRWYQQIHPDDRGRWNVEAASFILSGQPLRAVYRIFARDGHVVWFRCEAKMVRRAGGEPWFIHGVAFDISDLMEAERELTRTRDELEARISDRTAQLQEAIADLASEVAERTRAQQALAERADELARSNADLEQFAHSASHDLQEPIRNVSICSQLLAIECRGKLNAESERLIDTISASAKHMESLVRDLSEYLQVSRWPSPGDKWTDANRILIEVLQDLDASIRASQATISSDPLPSVRIAAVGLRQIFQNLISNAIKYRSAEPARIHLSATPVDGGWQIAVSDNGIGIDPAFHERIFGIFKRLHAADKYPGTGIGLAICKRIAENAGGSIRVESREGQGATFIVHIPELRMAADADRQSPL